MNNKIKVKKLFLLILFVQFISVAFAQMSDDQVVAMVKEAQNQGKTQQQIIMMLGQKGVTQEQLIRIKNNYTGKKSTAGEQTGNGMSRLRQENPPAVNILDSLNLEEDKELLFSKGSVPEIRIFGRDIFNNKQLTFEPNLNIATPENYVLGPGDEIIVDIWGGVGKDYSAIYCTGWKYHDRRDRTGLSEWLEDRRSLSTGKECIVPGICFIK